MNERKAIDTTFAFANIGSAAANITLINGCATGTDFTERIGRKILMKSLLLRAEFQPNTAVNNSIGEQVRFIVVYDMQTNGAALTTTDLLTAAATNAPNNLNNRDRFRILVDKYFATPPATFAAGVLANGTGTSKVIKIYKRFNLETIYSGTTAVVGSIQTGSLHVFTLSGNQFVATEWVARVRFEDA